MTPIEELRERLEEAKSGAICALAMLLDLKNVKTGRYAHQLSEWAVRVAEHMGLEGSALWDVEVGSILYDIGMIGVPDRILLKPGPLSAEEYALVRKHPEYGWGILHAIPGFERAALLVLHHHERFDGRGYPAGLSPEFTPLGARIIAVVDTLEAMLSDRPYRRGFSPTEVIERLRPKVRSQFDPEVFDRFIVIARRDLPEVFGLDEGDGADGDALRSSQTKAVTDRRHGARPPA